MQVKLAECEKTLTNFEILKTDVASIPWRVYIHTSKFYFSSVCPFKYEPIGQGIWDNNVYTLQIYNTLGMHAYLVLKKGLKYRWLPYELLTKKK